MKFISTAAVATALSLGAVGCGNFLDGPALGAHNPNAATRVLQPGPLYVGLEASQSLQFEAQVARTAALYVQQVAGVARQQAGYDRYTIASGDIDQDFTQVYAPLTAFGGSGISDARRIQDLARTLGDSLYIGIGKVWEALIIGNAAAVWGDVPYRQALQLDKYPTPKFDPQLQVYADVESQLDSAINIYFKATGPTNLGPTGLTRNDELIYAGRSGTDLATVYTAVAHTLKARFYIHQAKVDGSNYAKALAEAQLGISTPADDWNWFHATTPTSQNIWTQFQAARGDLGPGAAMINLMHHRLTLGLDTQTDRLNFYFKTSNAHPPCDVGCAGNRPSADPNLPGGGGTSDFAFINDGTINGAFHQPEVTFAETKLIAAEAAFNIGGQAAAQPFLDAVRANEAYGATQTGPVLFLAQPSVPATLQNIMEEKYIDLFLNIEAWRDYLRTCLPFLAPAPTGATAAAPGPGPIPGRLPYGQSEINTNPNVPHVGSTANNADTPNSCPRLTYTSVPAGY